MNTNGRLPPYLVITATDDRDCYADGFSAFEACETVDDVVRVLADHGDDESVVVWADGYWRGACVSLDCPPELVGFADAVTRHIEARDEVRRQEKAKAAAASEAYDRTVYERLRARFEPKEGQ